MPGLLAAVDRFNDAHPWDHNAHYHRWLLEQLPARVDRALDVGCGTGDLVRALAGRAAEVVGVDADPRVVDLARAATGRCPGVSFRVADAAEELPEGPFDVVTCVAVLHHLPFAPALERMRDRLAPGGTLLVLGVHEPSQFTDHLLGAAAVPANLAVGWARGRRPRPEAMTARTAPAAMTLPEIAREAGRILPGVRLRRHLFWRHSLLWRAEG
ncbi:class I SAM-dependent methyltransferase [Nocardiopsis changdeensis]|uniref:Class I SAM-dependent methyltransferase n=1 Tax=Nocardiopsis changdeensis TaxID=2831969 RepID=A0ABX8BTN4_9ACTN|nr:MULTISPECIES: class I SAM-dependent methyltransferase [Nocardiopsis]QUX25605.1 class I SAM-dependent methyltransferase [Nocardiopsis changdeensis]QYX35991.1 class I SAM-dependent methyltransferase [Nocardiopsis sp. MT53]